MSSCSNFPPENFEILKKKILTVRKKKFDSLEQGKFWQFKKKIDSLEKENFAILPILKQKFFLVKILQFSISIAWALLLFQYFSLEVFEAFLGLIVLKDFLGFPFFFGMFIG
jgi:hypothetical protein